MNIQIYALKRNFDVQKAERYFKERRIAYQFIDLAKRPFSPREMESVRSKVPLSELVDVNSDAWKESPAAYTRDASVISETLCANPRLLVTPIVRNGKQATAGYRPEVWEKWE